jgi:hypothetical protein
VSKLALANSVPRDYNAATFQNIVSLLEQQANRLAEGSITARHGAMTAAPTLGTWVKGDLVDNSAPSVVTTDVADYVIVGWICTASGAPGTWKERRVLVEAISAGEATQAEQETGTASIAYVSPRRQQFHLSAAKGWVYADYAASIFSSYNVISVTDNGTGDQTVNWGTDFSSATYAAFPSIESAAIALFARISAMTAGTTRIITSTTAGAAADATNFSAVAFGDQ